MLEKTGREASAPVRFEPLAPCWRDAWRAAYARYARAVGSPVDDAVAATVWGWLLARTHGVEGIVAIEAERLVGFSHFRPFPRTLDGNQAGYLDDLWVEESHRGSGLAQALIERVAAIGRERGWSELRWVVECENVPAQRLYDRSRATGVCAPTAFGSRRPRPSGPERDNGAPPRWSPVPGRPSEGSG